MYVSYSFAGHPPSQSGMAPNFVHSLIYLQNAFPPRYIIIMQFSVVRTPLYFRAQIITQSPQWVCSIHEGTSSSSSLRVISGAEWVGGQVGTSSSHSSCAFDRRGPTTQRYCDINLPGLVLRCRSLTVRKIGAIITSFTQRDKITRLEIALLQLARIFVYKGSLAFGKELCAQKRG